MSNNFSFTKSLKRLPEPFRTQLKDLAKTLDSKEYAFLKEINPTKAGKNSLTKEQIEKLSKLNFPQGVDITILSQLFLLLQSNK